jgi:hypothetical protein
MDESVREILAREAEEAEAHADREDHVYAEVDQFGAPMAAAYQFGTDLIHTAVMARLTEEQIAAVVEDWLKGQDDERTMLPFLVFTMPSAVWLTVVATGVSLTLPDVSADMSLTVEQAADRLALVRALELIRASNPEDGITVLRNRLFEAADERASAVRIVVECVLIGVAVCRSAPRAPRPVSNGGRHRLNELGGELFTPVAVTDYGDAPES